jgi:hypothetical protein
VVPLDPMAGTNQFIIRGWVEAHGIIGRECMAGGSPEACSKKSVVATMQGAKDKRRWAGAIRVYKSPVGMSEGAEQEVGGWIGVLPFAYGKIMGGGSWTEDMVLHHHHGSIIVHIHW